MAASTPRSPSRERVTYQIPNPVHGLDADPLPQSPDQCRASGFTWKKGSQNGRNAPYCLSLIHI